jgi:YidC/Oxa1 family membrane protein insertase
MNDQRNLIVAIVVSVAIMFGFQFFFEAPRQEAALRAQQELAEKAKTAEAQPQPGAAAPTGTSILPQAPATSGVTAPQIPGVTSADRVPTAASPRLQIQTPRLNGSISLIGARLDQLTLVDYRATVDPSSPQIVLFAPAGTANPYFAEFGWLPQDRALAVPGPDTPWQSESRTLTPTSPVVLRWSNGQGLTFIRTIAVDDNYMFTVTQRVENAGGAPVTLFPYALVSRTGTPETSGFFILHEGPVGVIDGQLREPSYDDVIEQKAIVRKTTGGWFGITDKYWLAALVPDQTKTVDTRFVHGKEGIADKYQADWLGEATTIAAGASAETKSHLFAGAKEVRLLDKYEEELGISRFDLAVDFGWFYFLTKPFFYALDFFYRLLGNFGLAILLVTVIVKIIFFPLANKSYVSMSAMKKLQPDMMKLRERYKDDRQKLNTEMMALYKRSKVNPASGCLPIVIQIPVFFALYKVLFVTIEMRHAPFYGWINDLSALDPTSIFNLFGLLPYEVPSFLIIGAWPLIMGVTMWLQMKLNPQPPDPIQAKIFMLMPIIFTVMLAPFPAGLVIYWSWNNLLSIAQQYIIMRRMGVKAT